ncbi:hypothetical protein FHG87_016509 [Trinorchestia longiramus]|nr:hypothetical protein FHG87_016509 [Trinorchestia longiramus]
MLKLTVAQSGLVRTFSTREDWQCQAFTNAPSANTTTTTSVGDLCVCHVVTQHAGRVSELFPRYPKIATCVARCGPDPWTTFPCVTSSSPAKGNVKRKRIGSLPMMTAGIQSLTAPHALELEFWCSSSHVEACKKCLVDRHKLCTIILVDEVVHGTNNEPVVDLVQFLQQKLSADFTASIAAASANLEALSTVKHLVDVVSLIKGQLETEQVSIGHRQEWIQTFKQKVTATPMVPTPQYKMQMLRYATEYHRSLENVTQSSRDNSNQLLLKLSELCNFAKPFQFPNRPQENKWGWFSGWW